jgi:hypothetical protein
MGYLKMNKAAKPSLLRSYRDSIIFSIMVLSFFAYPNFAMRLNLPPNPDQLEVLNGVILKAQKQHPNIFLKLDDGSVQALDFPGDLQGIYAAKYPYFHLESEAQLARLNGCNAVVHIDHLRGLLVPTNPRIWILSCSALTIPYDKLKSYYLKSIKIDVSSWILYIFIFIVLVLMIRNDSIARSK